MSSARDVPDWVTLGPNEQVVWSGHPSLYPAALSLVAGAVLFLLGPVSFALLPEPWSLIGIGLLLAGIAVALVTYFRHRSTRYVITSNEVYEKRGLLSRQVTSLRMDRVQNTTYEQSFLQRLLSYGDVHRHRRLRRDGDRLPQRHRPAGGESVDLATARRPGLAVAGRRSRSRSRSRSSV
ncbi:PH domain-containing protein, partial [Halomarina halobia]|uniref:PH domain-containing protein n=1 Tax=Halomarina halobia TaxID=3033386 RepID=UPI00360E9DDB